ncbi:MAG: aminopeptidase P family protein [Phycisphaerae bacterium]|nr:aminopeptidase P family protein [Phycisphaerae bacterium]
MSAARFDMTAPAEVFRKRRAKLAKLLQRPLVIFAGYSRSRNYPDNHYPFRAASNYLYFGGPPIEGAAWFIEPGSDGDRGSTLLRPEAGVELAVWFGELPSDDEIAAAAGVGKSSLVEPDRLESLVHNRKSAGIAVPCRASLDRMAALGIDETTPEEKLAIIDMRLIKDAHELTAMRRAADISVEAQLAAMHTCAHGRTEADVAAALHAVYIAHRAQPAFPPIITVHGEVLHGGDLTATLSDGQLLLADAGAEEPGCYASDITRTYPVSGAFTPIQRQLYDTVLRAQREAVEACIPGRRYRDIHELAARLLCEGLVEAEILKGNPGELAKRGAHTLFFTHGLGHLVGLDVHDMEDFGDLAGYAAGRERPRPFGSKFLRLDRDLEPGHVVTIEPGIYLVPALWQQDDLVRPFADAVNRRSVDALLRDGFGGIRIEDTVAVRGPDQAPEVLTARLPKDPEAVCEEVGRG